jgi:hypothetical protein
MLAAASCRVGETVAGAGPCLGCLCSEREFLFNVSTGKVVFRGGGRNHAKSVKTDWRALYMKS